MNFFKISISLLVAASLTSCSNQTDQEESEGNELNNICDCVKLTGKIMEEIETTDPAIKSQKEIEASYDKQLNICDSISKDYQKGFDQLSQEELVLKQEEFFVECPEAEELNRKMEARMQKMQQEMQQQMQEQMQQAQPGDSLQEIPDEMVPRQMEVK